jgi:flagellar basal-body rod protein FlgC
VSTAEAISRSGLDVEWQRLQVIAANLANLNSVAPAGTAPYHALRLISGPAGSFSDALAARNGKDHAGEVKVIGLEPVAGAERRVYDPTAPEAGPDGFVTFPLIDNTAEMALLIRTSRSYEANVTALGIAAQMDRQALEIGRG